ncbi:histidine phosphatase family protein [uncultured Secundilactobacillus sp.]|uniref:histidine phosphatase family protein n=1 Tax=uncultured Secundilactobacillus sp. TaxID=2813935 RepID=UPI00258E804D|nr:histidine phosphatase family protein [uncultured Secundilactobacillus sp.]
MNSFTVYLVRHGATFLNAYDRMQGWIDSDLSDDGITQSQEAAERLKDIAFDRAFSSDLGRAMTTRDIIVNHTPGALKENGELKSFREVNFGFFEGLNSTDIWHGIAAPYGKSTQADLIEIGGMEEARNAMKKADPSDEAESYDAVINRLKAGFQELRDHCEFNENILLVSHGTFIRTMADYLGVDTTDNYPKNGGISQLTVYEDQVAFESYNQ